MTNICHLFLYREQEVVFEVQAARQLAVGGHEECRGGLGSAISPLKVITVLEQLDVVHLRTMSVCLTDREKIRKF